MRDVYATLNNDDGEQVQWDLTKRYASAPQYERAEISLP